jgi:phosphatidylserine/phosphatidylglycerophosphate/cardiolipin synthase-like enzyme
MSSDVLRRLSSPRLLALAEALAEGHIPFPCSPVRVRSYAEPGDHEGLSASLNELSGAGFSPRQAARLLRELLEERRACEARAPGVELVWTGPESTASTSRDTFVVVRELFEQARQGVLISGYAIYNGRQIFEPLLRRQREGASLRVRLFLNISPDPEQRGQELETFARKFRQFHWEGPPWPEVYYDPRGLRGEANAVLHAKCIVVDERLALVTSANLTDAAQHSNIEAGTLVKSATFARHLQHHFETLVTRGQLLPLPVL